MAVEVLAGRAAAPTASAFHHLAAAFRGAILEPGHPDFEAAAGVHQLAAPGRPALIVRPLDTADVQRAITFGRTEGLQIAVRGGGHGGAAYGTTDGALVIDTRDLRELVVDPIGRRVRAGAGLAAGAVIEAAHEFGLTVPFGDNATVGIAGITLGGGVGYLSRQHGMTIDNLLAVELVTADGRVVTASEDSEPELFWAVRGGGGNFGVVTSLEFRLVEAGIVYGGALLLPPSRQVLRDLVRLAHGAPRELGMIIDLMPAPPAPFVPPAMVGSPVIAVLGVFNGDAADGEAAWAPFRALATPVADVVGPMPYPAIYRFSEGASTPMATAMRSTFLDDIDDDVVDALLEAYATSPGVMTIVQVRVLGGAAGDIPVDATAFGHRGSPFLVFALAASASREGVDACRVWADGLLDRLGAHATGAYSNFLEHEGEARVRSAFPEATYRRLALAKARWDPDNVFHLNANIVPARPEPSL